MDAPHVFPRERSRAMCSTGERLGKDLGKDLGKVFDRHARSRVRTVHVHVCPRMRSE